MNSVSSSLREVLRSFSEAERRSNLIDRKNTTFSRSRPQDVGDTRAYPAGLPGGSARVISQVVQIDKGGGWHV